MSVHTKRGAAVLAAMLLAAVTVQAATYYVDVSWTGTESGTENEPYQTIGAAVVAANASTGPHTITIAGGVYADVANGGLEDYSAGGGVNGGYNLAQRISFHGGYAGWDGDGTDPSDFDWTASSRVPRSTIIDLQDAGSRAFYRPTTGQTGTVTFNGFTFRNANHTHAGGTIWTPKQYNQGNHIVNCLFTNNVTTGNGGAVYLGGETLTQVTDSDFHDNQGANGGALYWNLNYQHDWLVGNCTFSNNTATAAAGAVYITGGSTKWIRDSRFIDNSAGSYGGGVFAANGRTEIDRCKFIGNSAADVSRGGAAVGGDAGHHTGSFTLINTLVQGNTGGYAVDMSGNNVSGGYTIDMRHCTVIDNTGGGVRSRHHSGTTGRLRIRNSIIANNGAYGITRPDMNDPEPILEYNNVFNNTSGNYFQCSAGTGSISEDPQFLDASGGDFRLAKGSPCIDTGMDLGVTTDLDGVGRPTREGFDMGAYEEWQIPIIENRAVIAVATEAEVRAEFVYESEFMTTDAWFVIGTLDPGTDVMADWWQSANSGEQVQDVIFGHTFSGLDPDTTYVYRCVASNSYDMLWGPLGTFKTPAAGGVTRLWTGLGGDGLASNPDNWDGAEIPDADDYILLDSSPSNMTWNAGVNGLPDTVARWTQTEHYTGTVSLKGTLTVDGQMTINNGTLQTEKDAVSGINVDDRLTIGPVATVIVRRSSTTVTDAWGTPVGAGQTITAGSAVIDGLLSADGQGFNVEQGPAFGNINRAGSHGGEGANNPLSTYGSVTHPTALGSGGRSGGDNTATGGGAIVLAITGNLTVNGMIGADASHTGQSRRGAGGSITITAATLSGSGTIRANGGVGYRGGGGGRVALMLTEGTDFGAVESQAFGGCEGGVHNANGAAGTVYLKHAGDTGLGRLIVDNNGSTTFGAGPTPTSINAYTRLSAGGDVVHDFAEVIIRNHGNLGIRDIDLLDVGAVTITANDPDQAFLSIGSTNGVVFPNPFTLGAGYSLCLDVPVEAPGATWTIPDGAVLSHSWNCDAQTYRLVLTLDNLTVSEGAAIDVRAKGYGKDGPGAGDSNRGASHGGGGGHASTSSIPPTYGSILNPETLGSNTDAGHHQGGGAVILTVHSALWVDGVIDASSNDGSRLGSGGSVNITAGTLGGDGMIRANSGTGFRAGGGGRVAVALTTGEGFGQVAMEAIGGVGTADSSANSAAGTVYRRVAGQSVGHGDVRVDNAGITVSGNATTALPAFSASDEDLANTHWTARNQGKVGLVAAAEIGSLELGPDGYLELAGYTVTIARLTIDGEEVRWGNYQAGAEELGARVTDAASGGWVIIPAPPPGTLMLIR